MEGSSLGSITIGIAIILVGYLLFIYRDTLGDMTGYIVGRGTIVDKPSPGCLLIPFALAVIVVGSIFLVKGIYRLIAG